METAIFDPWYSEIPLSKMILKIAFGKLRTTNVMDTAKHTLKSCLLLSSSFLDASSFTFVSFMALENAKISWDASTINKFRMLKMKNKMSTLKSKRRTLL